MNKKLLVFASGSATGGGSGFENLVRASRDGRLNANIVGVVSNHLEGGVYRRATELGIPFTFFSNPQTPAQYQEIAAESRAEFFALSGWLRRVVGLDLSTRFNQRTVFNIHPGPLPQFGGPGMYGHRVHEAVMEAFGRGELLNSAVTMHFVTPGEYDTGPVFFRRYIGITQMDTAETLARGVNQVEHEWQPIITDLVVRGDISWDGVDPKSLKVPSIKRL